MAEWTEDDGTYQMLWDCGACGTAKLLGVTHRFCSACGAPQDPTARYFPSDAERIAVGDHPLVGRDVECDACSTPNAANAANCMACGSPLEGAKEVGVRADVLVGQAGSFTGQTVADAKAEKRQEREDQGLQARGLMTKAEAAAKKKRSRNKKIAAGAVVGVGGIVGVFVYKTDVKVTVDRVEWSRTIDIERYGPQDDSAWCNSMPGEAYQVRRKREVKSHKKIPDGKDCKTRKVDQGNGSFKEVRECKTKYRQEPVYGEKCYFKVDRWAKHHDVKNVGDDVTDERTWPQFELTQTGPCNGCEREGARRETLTVFFTDEEGETHECAFKEAKWAKFSKGASIKAKAGAVSGDLDCETVKAPSGD